jgi:fibronectin type 3 domain-containing protein
VTLTTNTSAGKATVALSGAGQSTTHEVDLSWSAPSGSTDAPVGYNVYRAVSGTSSYQKLNSSLNGSTSYADTTVAGSTTYVYYVTSVDAAGVESNASNNWTAVIP